MNEKIAKMPAVVHTPPDDSPWKVVDLDEAVPSRGARRTKSGKPPVAEASPGNPVRKEQQRLQQRTGLPLTSLSEEEWDELKLAATKLAAEKLRLSLGAAASHWEEFVAEAYKAMKSASSSSKNTGGDFSEDDDEKIRRTREYAREVGLSFNEAARYIT